MSNAFLDRFLADLTPERLRKLILELVEARPPDERDGIDVSALVAHLIEKSGIGPGPERGQAYTRFVEAVKARVAAIEGMRYIESRE